MQLYVTASFPRFYFLVLCIDCVPRFESGENIVSVRICIARCKSYARLTLSILVISTVVRQDMACTCLFDCGTL